MLHFRFSSLLVPFLPFAHQIKCNEKLNKIANNKFIVRQRREFLSFLRSTAKKYNEEEREEKKKIHLERNRDRFIFSSGEQRLQEEKGEYSKNRRECVLVERGVCCCCLVFYLHSGSTFNVRLVELLPRLSLSPLLVLC